MRLPEYGHRHDVALRRFARGSSGGRSVSALPATAPKQYPDGHKIAGDVCAARFQSNNPTVNHGDATKKFSFSLADYAVNTDGLSYTTDDSGHIIDGWPSGWYHLEAACSVWYTSPSGGLRPSILVAGGGSAWDAQWLPIDLPAKASEISPSINFSLGVDLNIAAGDSGFYVELAIYASSAGDTVNASCILTVTRWPGYPGST